VSSKSREHRGQHSSLDYFYQKKSTKKIETRCSIIAEDSGEKHGDSKGWNVT